MGCIGREVYFEVLEDERKVDCRVVEVKKVERKGLRPVQFRKLFVKSIIDLKVGDEFASAQDRVTHKVGMNRL